MKNFSVIRDLEGEKGGAFISVLHTYCCTCTYYNLSDFRKTSRLDLVFSESVCVVLLTAAQRP